VCGFWEENIRQKERTYSRITELTRMSEDSSRSINLTQLPLQRGEPEAHLGSLRIGELFDRSFVDGSSGGKTKVGSSFRDVVSEHLIEGE